MEYRSGKTQDARSPQPGLGGFAVSLFDNRYDITPKPAIRDWDALITLVKSPVVRASKDGPLFSPARFKDPHRLNEHVTELSLLVLDYDHHAIWLEDFKPWQALDLRFFAYTSHSHLRKTDCNPKAEPRFRIGIPLKEMIPPDRFSLLWEWAKRISGDKIDENVKDLSRMYYLPAKASRNAPYEYYVNDGDPLDWHAAIDSLPDNFAKEIALETEKKKRAPKAKAARPDVVINLEECEPIIDPIILEVVNRAKKRIAESVPGEQHFRRLREGKLLGGLIPHLLTYEQAYNALAPEVQKTALDFHKAMKDIADGLAYGRAFPITREDLEAQYAPNDINIKVEEDPQPESDGQIIDDDYDPPVSTDPVREKYLRQMLFNSSLMTEARMFVAVALGFSRVPWRFLNAIHSFRPGRKNREKSLKVKIISDEMMASRYRESDENGTSIDAIRRDRRKLRKQQSIIGVLLVEIWPGCRNPITGETFATKYLSNLDRWALQAIDMATDQKQTRNGLKFYTYTERLEEAAKTIAAGIPRNPISDNENLPAKSIKDYHAIAIGFKKYIEERGKELTSAAVVEKIETNQVLSDLANFRRFFRDLERDYLARTRKLSYDDEPFNIEVEDDDLPADDPQGTISPTPPSTEVEECTFSPTSQESTPDEFCIVCNSAHYTKNSPCSVSNVDSTTYDAQSADIRNRLESDEMTAMWRDLSERRECVRERFKAIQPDPARLFVKPEHADEIIRLAAELDALDRQEWQLFEVEPVEAIDDPLVRAIVEDEIETIRGVH